MQGATMGIKKGAKSGKCIRQFELVTGIMKLIAKHGPKSLHVYQMNAVIAAANDIMASLERPFKPAVPGMGLKAWCESDDTGRSSEFMMRITMTGLSNQRGPYPSDPDDLGRCIRFLEAVPEARQHLDRMKSCSPRWYELIRHWNELEALYREEAPTGKCPKLYDRMQELIKSAPDMGEG